jgi:hypothetical protein
MVIGAYYPFRIFMEQARGLPQEAVFRDPAVIDE